MARRLLATSALALLSVLAAASPALAAWTWPADGEVITSYLNGADPYAAGQHRGIDIAGPVGAPVVAATAGTVRFAGTAGSSGLTVSVRTSDGRLDLSYLHLSSLAVGAGQRVAAGTRIGAVGTTGRRSAAQPHVHFGVRDAGSAHGYHDPSGLPVPAGQPRRPARPGRCRSRPRQRGGPCRFPNACPGPRPIAPPSAGCPSASRPRARAGPARPARAAAWRPAADGRSAARSAIGRAPDHAVPSDRRWRPRRGLAHRLCRSPERRARPLRRPHARRAARLARRTSGSRE